MDDAWREAQQYALRQTRICSICLGFFRWLAALLAIACAVAGLWWMLRGNARGQAALGLAGCGAGLWLVIGLCMKPYAQAAGEIVSALNAGQPPQGGYSPMTAWMVHGYTHMHPALFLLFALLWLVLGAVCIGGGGALLASEIGCASPHIPSLVMGAGLSTLGVTPAIMGLIYIIEGLLGFKRRGYAKERT